MTVSVYTLRIREDGDDAEGTQVRIVAASLTEAVARAEMRFGPGRIASIEQADANADEIAAAAAESAAAVDPDSGTPEAPSEAPIVADDFIVARAPESLPDVDALHAHASPPAQAPNPAAFAIERAIRGASTPHVDTPPWEGRWRPAVLLWGGMIAGVVAFVLWMNFGDSPRDRFIVAQADATPAQPGLPLDGDAPPGGVLTASGVTLRRGRADAGLGDMVESVVSNWPDDGAEAPYAVGQGGEAAVDDNAVRAIGTLVGEVFARLPGDEPAARVPQPSMPVSGPSYPGADRPWPDERIASMPQPMPEPALLRRWYVEVQRADRVTETLSVNAVDAEHALAIVYDRPDHPVIVRGPSTELSW